LSKFCTEQDLEALFGKYGEITDVKIKRNITTGTNSLQNEDIT
jgi:RNA recognition motif-containing protein